MENLKKFNANASLPLMLTFAAIFAVMLALNVLYPTMSDDYQFRFVWRGEYGSIYNLDADYPLRRVDNVDDIIESLYSMYFTWGGRMLTWGLVYFFVQVPHIIFDLLNALVFMLFLSLLAMLGTAVFSWRQLDYRWLGATFLLLWGASSMFANVYLWLCGSCVYLWVATVQLGFLFFYVRNFIRDSNTTPPIIFVMGVIAGWSNENTGFVVILIAMTFTYFARRKSKVCAWQFWGICGAILGYTVLMASPGNFAKLSETVANPDTLQDLERQYARVKLALMCSFPLLLVFLRLPKLRIGENTSKARIIARIFLLGGLVNGAMMIPLPNFPARTLTMTVVFWLIGVLHILSVDTCWAKNKACRIMCVAYLILSFISLPMFMCAMGMYFLPQDQARDVIAENSAGKDVILPPYQAPPWAMVIVNLKGYRADMGTISPRTYAWPNVIYAKYWNLKSIVRTED